MFQLLLIFFVDIITSTIISAISSTPITCDVMCVQYAICNSTIITQSTEKKTASYQKIYKLCFTFKSNLNIKNLGQSLTCILIKKLISNFIVFETNKYIHRNGYLRVADFKTYSRQEKA